MKSEYNNMHGERIKIKFMSLRFYLYTNYVYIKIYPCVKPDGGLLGRNLWLKII